MAKRILIGALLAASTVLPANGTTEAWVEARLVCSTSTNRCYVQNPNWSHAGAVPHGAPCRHVHNVSWAITSEWPTYSWYRGYRCGSWN